MTADGRVIVGASLAGAKAAAAARAQGWTGPIKLAGAERHLPYERPPLSKSGLIGGSWIGTEAAACARQWGVTS